MTGVQTCALPISGSYSNPLGYVRHGRVSDHQGPDMAPRVSSEAAGMLTSHQLLPRILPGLLLTSQPDAHLSLLTSLLHGPLCLESFLFPTSLHVQRVFEWERLGQCWGPLPREWSIAAPGAHHSPTAQVDFCVLTCHP